MALSPSPQQLKLVRRYATDASIILAEALLGEKNAEAFSNALFDVSVRYGDRRSRRSVNALVIAYAQDIIDLDDFNSYGKLVHYTYEGDGPIALLKAALERSTKFGFFYFSSTFEKIYWKLPRTDRFLNPLDEFVTDRAPDIMALEPSHEEIRWLAKLANLTPGIESSVALLKAGLGRAESADDFVGIFNAIAHQPSRKFRHALEQFMIDNSEAISALNLSFQQISTMNRTIGRNDLFNVLTVSSKMGKSCAGSTAALLVPGAPAAYKKVP